MSLINRYISITWKHNEGYTSRWLRRVTRETEKYIICDVRHTLWFNEKDKAKFGSYRYKVYKPYAKRFKQTDTGLVEVIGKRRNPDGVNYVNLIEDFNTLLCEYKYNDLFETDVRILLPKDTDYNDILGFPKDSYCITPKLVDEQHRLNYIAEHLNKLFNRPVYFFSTYIELIHEASPFSYSATHYHINHFGNDKEVLTSDEVRKNCTIAFWLFEDKVVFKFQTGIDTW